MWLVIELWGARAGSLERSMTGDEGPRRIDRGAVTLPAVLEPHEIKWFRIA